MNSLLNNSNSKSSNSNISNNSTHLAQLNHQLNSLQVNQTFQQQQQSNGQLIPHQQPPLVHHSAQLKYNRDFIENLLEGDLILQVSFELFLLSCWNSLFKQFGLIIQWSLFNKHWMLNQQCWWSQISKLVSCLFSQLQGFKLKLSMKTFEIVCSLCGTFVIDLLVTSLIDLQLSDQRSTEICDRSHRKQLAGWLIKLIA